MLVHSFKWPEISLPLAPKLTRYEDADIDAVEFMGPAAHYIMGQAYTTLCEGGPKEQGMPRPGPKYWVPEQAWDAFRTQFFEFASGAKQIAWRELPSVAQAPEDGSWMVTCRLVVFR